MVITKRHLNPRPAVSQEVIRMIRFASFVTRFGAEYPEYKDHVEQAQAVIKRAQLRAFQSPSPRWRWHPAIRQLTLDIWERLGVVPY